MLAEQIREEIRKMINVAKGNIKMSEEIEHMIVQISFEMYKAGYKEALKIAKLSISELRNQIDA